MPGDDAEATIACAVGTRQFGLEVLKDSDGSVALGWVGPDVLYARFAKGLSAKVGSDYADRLQSLLEQAKSVGYYMDCSGLERYDLLARSAFVRVALANRRTFACLVVLTWSEGVGPAAEKFAAALGGSAKVITDPAEFETRLQRAAPLARRYLDPKTWVVAASQPRSSR